MHTNLLQLIPSDEQKDITFSASLIRNNWLVSKIKKLNSIFLPPKKVLRPISGLSRPLSLESKKKELLYVTLYGVKMQRDAHKKKKAKN